MIAYVFIYVLAVGLIAISYLYPGSTIRNCFAIGLWGVLAIFAGFRYDVGLDYISYLDQIRDYRYAGNLSWEYAYPVFLSINNSIGLTDQGLFLAMAMITALFFYKYLSFHSRRPLMATLFFITLPPLFLSTLNVSRQFVAVSIFAFALRYIVKQSFILYFFFIALAFCFHKSAILALPLYFFLNRAPSLKLYVILSGLYLLALPLLQYFVGITGASDIYFALIDEPEVVTPKTYIFVMIFLFVVFLTERLQRIDCNVVIFINMLFLVVILSITPAFIPIPSAIYWRTLSYFVIAAPILIVSISDVIAAPTIRAFYLMGVTLTASGYYFYTLIERGTYFNLVPYDTNLFLFDLY